MTSRTSLTASMEEERKSSGRKSKKGGKVVKTQNAEEIAKRREALKESLRHKVELEQRAFCIVQRLLEDNVNDEFLSDCARFITPANYKDVVEERSIAKMCGYPICPNQLGNVPKQKYKISTKTNKVYDITERKCFCANFCYSASKYFEAQISKTPLWLREEERPSDVKLLSKEERGSSGEEMKISDQPVREADIENPLVEETAPPRDSMDSDSLSSETEQDFISGVVFAGQTKLPKNRAPERNRAGDRTAARKRVSFADTPQTGNVRADVSRDGGKAGEGKSNREPDTGRVGIPEQRPVEEASSLLSELRLEGRDVQETPSVEGRSSLKLSANKLSSTKDSSLNIARVAVSKKGLASLRSQLGMDSGETVRSITTSLLQSLRHMLREWRTEDTMRFLHGPGYASAASKEDGDSEQVELDEDDLEVPATAESPDRKEQWRPSAPVPDYDTLRRETELLNVRVQEFYRGVCVLPNELGVQEDPSLEHTDQGAVMRGDPVIPLVDSHAQHVIQTNIVMEKLNRSLTNIIGPLRLTMNDVTANLNNLVRTFRFTNQNIIHKSPEWTLIALVLLLVLSDMSVVLRESLANPSSTEYISTLMKELTLNDQDLQSLVQVFKS